MPWPCAVHHLCCRPFPDHRKAPPRSPGLCRWPSSLPVIQTHSFHESNSLSHCHWKLCGRTEERMISNMLMVNDSKTEFLIVGSKQQLERVNIPFIHVGEDQITPVTSVRNLGVIFDSNLKMDMQITKACQNAYYIYHLHNIRRIRKFLSHAGSHVHDYTCIY